MPESLGIAIVGGGTVGSGVAEILLGHAERLTRRTGGRALRLRHIVVRDAAKPRPGLPAVIVHPDWTRAVRDPEVAVVLELIGGVTTARDVVLAALAAGKDVVTANKALLAAHGPELFAAARTAGRAIGFEAAVAGGIPIIKALAESLAANQVTAIQGILNGTSNFILSSMADRGISYADALAEAQSLGYAEADPTLDVDGSDAAHKLAVLAQIAFGVTPRPGDILTRGIAGLDALDIRFAAELGYTIKLLAEAWTQTNPNAEFGMRNAESIHAELGMSNAEFQRAEFKTDELNSAKRQSQQSIQHSAEVPHSAFRIPHLSSVSLHVSPVLLRSTDLLAQVRGAFNAVRVIGDIVGETVYQGPGAGKMPTASSVLSDVIDLAIGRLPATFAAAKLWNREQARVAVGSADHISSRFYLRVLVKDRPGVLADVCGLLAADQISIASVVQHEAIDGHPEQTVPLVIMTHAARAGEFRHAVAEIDRLPTVVGPAVYYPVGD
jgi:homoserine dehydrogenase